MIMRNIFKFMLFIALGAIIFVSCEEDKFTEKDAMEALQHIDLSLTVQNGSANTEAVEGATVTVVKDSSTVEKTTDAAGSVVFNDMPVGGNLSVYVNKENYTKAVFTVSTSTNEYRKSQISKTVNIYPLSGENMATVKGQLTIETDLTNRKREKLGNQEVRVVNNSLGSNVESSFVGTTDEDGNYSIKVPVNADGNDDLEVKFPSAIDTTQTLAMGSKGMYEGSYKVVTIPAVYYPDNYDPSDIPAIPSVSATIAAPSGSEGSGFELGTKPRGTPFTSESELELIQGGSGYHVANGNDTLVPMSEGVNGNTAMARVWVNQTSGDQDSSSIQSITVEDNGALYTSAPTLDLSGLGGSGAVFEIRFECEQLIYIKNNGTGYNSIPNFSVTLKWYENEKLVERSGFDMSLENITRLVDGSIYPDASGYGYSEDTILSYNANEITELSTSSSIGQQAIMKINSNDVSANDSTITDWYFEQNGIGYDPANPPAVSLTSLADYGSGAKFVVEVDNNGTFEENDMVMKDGGEGYVRNVNDFQGKGYTGTYGGDDYSLPNGSYIHNVKPGDVLRRSIYYGTGIRQSEE
jgi:hypothetical protein